MKMRKILAFAAAVSALAIQSCSKQDEVFDESSSARMSEYLENVHSVLQAHQYGWIMEYYPGSSYAAVSMALQFTSDKVTAASEKDPYKKATSTYRLTTDDGPVLTFDTYNEVLHYYAAPSSSKYQGRGGDFEFAILSCSTSEIVLRGRRSRNIYRMKPLQIKGDYYLDDVNYMSSLISVSAVLCTVDGKEYIGYLDSGTRMLSIGDSSLDEDALENVRYVVTDKGISFNRTVSLGGVDFSEWEYDSKAEKFTAQGYDFNKTIPAGWVSYEDYLGKYTLYYDNGAGSIDVTLVRDVEGSTFKMKGLISAVDIEIGYSSGRGRLTWVRQTLGGSGNTEYVLCPWDSDAGYLTWLEGVGMYGAVKDASHVPDYFEVRFSDNKVWESYYATGWVSYAIKGEERTSPPARYNFANGDYRLPGDITMVRGTAPTSD